MKEYPSIPGPSKAPCAICLAFYKFDGSCLRFEWTKKRGWDKFGTRTRLFDHTDPDFGEAIEIFMDKYAKELEAVIRSSKHMWNAMNVTAYAEFFGPNSFAGQHANSDTKDVVLFDFNIHKKGLLGPTEFIAHFGHLPIPQIVYNGVLNASFIEAVRNNDVRTPSGDRILLNEGVVCKGGTGHGLWMCKIKTNAYREKLVNCANPAISGNVAALWE